MRQTPKAREAADWARAFAIVALDPADGSAQGDEQATVAAGLGEDGHIYILHSDGERPRRWCG